MGNDSDDGRDSIADDDSMEAVDGDNTTMMHNSYENESDTLNDNIEVIEESDGKVEWTDEFLLPSNINSLLSCGRTTRAGRKWSWKNAIWSTLMVFEYPCVKFYFGIDDPSETLPDFKLKVRFVYCALNPADGSIIGMKTYIMLVLGNVIDNSI